MNTKRICHIRGFELGRVMSHQDMMSALNGMKQAYPELIFFAPSHFWSERRRIDSQKIDSCDQPSRDLTTFFFDAGTCFAALGEEQSTFQRQPAIRMAMRAPWEEDIASGDIMRLRARKWSGHISFYDDDPTLWRQKGRLVDMTVPAIEPRVVRSVEHRGNRWLMESHPQRPNKTHSPESFGDAREIDSLSQFAQAFSWYNKDDPETDAFMLTLRRLFNQQVTTRVALYHPVTGHFIERYRCRYKYHIGRDLLAWLCHHPGIYNGITSLDNPGEHGRLGAYGPAPDFKAEVFLEAGLPIDDIDGLTPSERDRVLRRHEKALKAKRSGIEV